MSDLDYISDFDDEAKKTSSDNPGGPVDFSIAQKIEGNTGSTCDVYTAQYHQTKVLIKRLKPSLKDKVLYRNALEKEFNLGFRLKHNGLPTYREFHGDYIIIEFIEGDTLSELIRRKDPWLAKERNIHKILTQLIEVVLYLHANGISHCDIKPDNIIITKGHHNLMLIDLDKTYTAYNPNSSGTTSHFDIEESKTGHPDMDFHGIGKLVDRIIRTIPRLPVKKFQKFEKLCMGNNVDADELLEWLNQTYAVNKRKSPKQYFLGDYGFIIIVLLILAGVGFTFKFLERDVQKERTEPIENNPTVKTEEPEAELSKDVKIPNNSIPNFSQPKLPDYKKEIDSQMNERFNPLKDAISIGDIKLANPNTSDNELRDVLYKISNTESQILKQAYFDFEERYPNVDAFEIQMAVINSSAYKNVSKKANDLVQKITDELVTRNADFHSKHPSIN